MSWTERLRRAGARELYVVISLDDLPGPPVVVVPLGPGADAAGIGSVLCGRGGGPAPIAFAACATIRDAVVAGAPTALERVRKLRPDKHPDLAAAFAAVGDEAMGVRIVLASSPRPAGSSRRWSPTLPRELGGGPITEFTRGVLWVAAGLDGPGRHSAWYSPRRVPRPPGRSSAADRHHRVPGEVAVRRDVPRLVSQLKAEVHADRLGLTADAEVAASLMDAVLQPGAPTRRLRRSAQTTRSRSPWPCITLSPRLAPRRCSRPPIPPARTENRS